jgi:thimet oligopeptidase
MHPLLTTVVLVVSSTLVAPSMAAPSIPASPDEIMARMQMGIDRADSSLNAILAIGDTDRTYDNTVAALDRALGVFDADTSMVQFMAYVHPSVDMRTAGRGAEQAWNNWMVDLGKNEGLYRALALVAAQDLVLSGEQSRLLDHVLRDYRRSGMALSAEDRATLADLEREINDTSQAFDAAINDDETVVGATRDELDGLPERWIAGRTPVDGLYLLGMDYPTIVPILEYSPNAALRQKIWMARKRRAGKANVQRLEQLLRLRAKQASLLGYANAADFENEIRMSGSAKRVQAFYETLRPMLRAKAIEDHALLTAAKRADTGDQEATLKPWDFSYYMEQVKQRDFEVDGNVVREYFPMTKVRDGLFDIVQRLYGVRMVPKAGAVGSTVWHEDVEWFDVVDANGEMLGEFFMDLYPREGKYGHAAQWGLVPRVRRADGSLQRPVAALVCNFPSPTDDQPSLLSHDQTETFFHEFGHGLHTLLAEGEIARFSGTGVERDFVEAPSQMFEAWVWSPETLPLLSGHYETGEPLPSDLLQRMVAAKTLCSGMMNETQVHYGLTDLTFHLDPEGDLDTTEVGKAMLRETTLFVPVDETWFQGSFGHLTGYQAGYYGYMWSRVFAEDMAEHFKAMGMLSPEAGAHYRATVLSRGGSQSANDMLKAYLGREPTMDAFIRSLGL